MKLIDIFFKYCPLYLIYKVYLDDQILINQIVHQGFLELYGIKFEIDSPNIHFATFSHTSIPFSSSKLGFIQKPEKKWTNEVSLNSPYLHLVHKYDRYFLLIKSINIACFKKKYFVKDYIRNHSIKLKILKHSLLKKN